MKLIFKSAIIFILFVTITNAQTGTRLVDFNAKSIGRGGTSIGVFDSNNLLMTNPAGISFLNNSAIDVNLSLMFPKVHFKNSINDADGDDNVFPLPSLSYVNKYQDSNFSWGIGFFTYGGMGADYKLNHNLFRDMATGKFIQQEYHSQIALMQGGLTAAYKLSENLSVGASLHLVYSTLEFAMPYSLKPSIMKGMAMPGMTFGQMFGAPPQMGGFGYDEVTAYAKMSDLTALGFNGKIGIAYKVNENLSIGLNYSSPITLTYKDGKADMDMTAQLMDGFGKAVMGYMMQNPGSTQQQAQGAIMSQFAQMGIDLSKGAAATYDMEAELSFPQSFGFGLSYKINRDFMVAADFEYLNWADAFDKMSLKLSNGNNPNINKMIGSSSMNIDFPMNWENSLLIKVGVEYNATPDLALRVGFANGANPVPSSTIFSIFPAVVENHITAGLSYKVSAPLTINAALEMGLENSVDGSKPHVLAHEYEGSTSTLSTTLLHLGVSYNL